MKSRNYKIVRILAITLWFGCFQNAGAQEIAGHYVYSHSWCYAVGEDSMFCSEVGTMDYEADGSAVDHAYQTYLLKSKEGDKVVWTFDYFSPSFWRRQGDDFFFKGDAATFSMKLLSNNMESDVNVDADWYQYYAGEIITSVSRNIANETKFHIAELSECRFVWSYTYRDGHTDYWEFLRQQYSK